MDKGECAIQLLTSPTEGKTSLMKNAENRYFSPIFLRVFLSYLLTNCCLSYGKARLQMKNFAPLSLKRALEHLEMSTNKIKEVLIWFSADVDAVLFEGAFFQCPIL